MADDRDSHNRTAVSTDGNTIGDDEKQKYALLSGFITEQYTLSRDLYSLTECQRRLVQDSASRPHTIGRALEETAAMIKEKIDRLCLIREEIAVLYPNLKS
jgi:hypothetical protein